MKFTESWYKATSVEAAMSGYNIKETHIFWGKSYYDVSKLGNMAEQVEFPIIREADKYLVIKNHTYSYTDNSAILSTNSWGRNDISCHRK